MTYYRKASAGACGRTTDALSPSQTPALGAGAIARTLYNDHNFIRATARVSFTSSKHSREYTGHSGSLETRGGVNARSVVPRIGAAWTDQREHAR
jgi:hypothetical protein